MHWIKCVHTLNLLPCFFRRQQVHKDVNPANDQDTFFRFYLACHICGQLPVAGINMTRFQRASKCS